MIYRFNHIEVNANNFTIINNGQTISIEPRVFNLIAYLIQNRDRLVSRQAIFENIWGRRIVSDASINDIIKTARRVLNDDGRLQQVIKTIHGRGYQFIAQIEETDKEPETTLNKSIAVLAFTDLSHEQNLEYLTDGISEEIITLLDKIPDLRVISRTSSFSYKGQSKSIKGIGQELGVTHILEGSVRKSGDNLRITTQLTKVSDSSHLWSDIFNHTMNDIFKTQDDIADAVIKQLHIELFGKSIKTVHVDPDAYSLYLQANYLHHKFTADAMTKAEEIIRQSIRIDKKAAPAWYLLSKIIFRSTFYLYQKPFNDGLKTSREAILTALKLDHDYALAYAQLSIINILSWDFKDSIDNINKAITLGRWDSSIIEFAANNAMDLGRVDEAVKLFNQSIKLNPLSEINYYNLGIVYLWLNRLEDAKSMLHQYNTIKPNAALHHMTMASIFLRQGKNNKALKEAEKEPHDFWRLLAKNLAVFALNRKNKANKLLEKFTIDYSENHPSSLAYIYAFRGETNNAFRWLEISFVQKDPELVTRLNYSYFKNLYADPRWSVFISKMNFPDDHWLL